MLFFSFLGVIGIVGMTLVQQRGAGMLVIIISGLAVLLWVFTRKR